MKLPTLKVREKVAGGIFAILFILLVAVGASTVLVGRISSNARFVEEVAFSQTLYSQELDGVVKQMILRMEADINAGEFGETEQLEMLNGRIREKFSRGKNTFSERASLLDSITELERGYEEWYRVAGKYLENTVYQNWGDIADLAEKHTSLSNSLIDGINALKEEGTALLGGALADINRLSTMTKRVGILLGLLAFLASVAIALTLNRALMRPISTLSGLMKKAERGDFTALFGNERLVPCWEELNCGKKECAAYGSSNLRCWQVTGTHCQGEVQGDLAMKIGNCEKCDVYGKAVRDEFSIIGESYNNMLVGINSAFGQFRKTTDDIFSVTARLSSLSSGIKDGSAQQFTSIEEADSSIREMDQSIREVTGSVSGFLQTAENSASATEEMSASISQVAAGSENLAEVVTRTSAAIEELFASIKETAAHVDSLSADASEVSTSIARIGASGKESENSALMASRFSEEVVRDIGVTGKEAIEGAVEGVRKTIAIVTETGEVIDRLGSKSKDIGSILDVISEISEQTNLLALNAAIIAAQAGEHGRGFSVVAEEIRTLAERTSASAKEIGSLITTIQQGLDRAVRSMQKGVVSVEEGAALIENVNEKLREAASSSDKSAEHSKLIVRSVSDQTQAVELISQAASNMSDRSRQVAAAAGEQSTTCDQLARAVTEIASMTEQFKRATVEQSKTARQISEASRESREVVRRIDEAATQEAKESQQIVASMESVKEVAETNSEVVGVLEEVVLNLQDRSSALRSELEKFTTT